MIRISLLWMAFATNLYGVIGESESEIKARYGDPTETMPTESVREIWKAYKSDGGRIIYVAFLDGRSQMETYKMPDGSPPARTDIEAILKANGSGAEWQRDASATGRMERWYRLNTAGEEEAIALYDPKSASSPFTIMTRAFRDYRKQQNRTSR
jgi:hypothetical protein